MNPEQILNQLETKMKEYRSLTIQLLKCEDANIKNEIVEDKLVCVGIIQNHNFALQNRFGLPPAIE